LYRGDYGTQAPTRKKAMERARKVKDGAALSAEQREGGELSRTWDGLELGLEAE